jgi:type IV pilus assembly protein PilV
MYLKPSSLRGFTLIEVMVALIVISIGMLGIAKLQALYLSSTGTSRLQSLAALEASSLAAAMHANRGYWASATTVGAAAPTLSVTGNTVTMNTGPAGWVAASIASPGAAPACMIGGGNTPAGACTVNAQLASSDMLVWANSLKALLPQDGATVTCSNNTVSSSNPQAVSCAITIQWSENAVAANNQEAQYTAGNGAAKFQANALAAACVSGSACASYTLYVVP